MHNTHSKTGEIPLLFTWADEYEEIFRDGYAVSGKIISVSTLQCDASMLTIHQPEIIVRENETVLQAKFECGNTNDVLWFSTTNEFGGYLCNERGDAFLVAMLLYAMKRGENIHILAPISERLYYTLTRHFVKVIADMFPRYHQIQIIGDIDSGNIDNAGGVGTGFSCGIDSFCTVIEHTDKSCPPDYKLTHLTFFNVGASGDYGGDHSRDLFHKRIDTVRPCADELKLPLVTLDSNINEILDMNFVSTHTYRNVAAVLALQKLFKTYYYSSSDSLWQFKLTSEASGYYDIYGLNMLSTNDTQFISSGEIYSRVEKTKIVSKHPLSYKYLNVCVAADKNCSRCLKCQRTLVTLDLLGKLDLYNNVFDLNDYQMHRSKYFGLVLSGRKNDAFKQEIYDVIKRDNFSIPSCAYLYRYPQAIFQLGMRHCPEFIVRQYRNLKRHRILNS
ncbi:hypothetical protein DU57_02365 [Methanosarcina mazei]|uniref:Uncharacterized protein n=1 Tax=Methanosarcina mazei TaxID=2209 RepID=A0A0F8L105_METMZ|nr:hypothetical protein [Methanosarcina mazei]KKG84864.1 hypothetical protein DU57_02365 [Methanosarcina mazei]KKG86765.1 hypothetical protein DU59_05035 [Methanosarcina mazei]KKH03877.1 hypothetical protein DU42_03935 [Methanosarcina mazei]